MNKRSEFFIPNLINYVRIIIVVLMLFKIRTKPVLAFILCLISGFMDSFDGDMARYFNQKSKLGYIMDLSLDRLTNSAQMVTLALLYPKYWLFFFSIQSVDTIRDFSKAILQHQQFLVDSIVNNLSGDKIRNDIFERLEIKNVTFIPKISTTTPENFNLRNFLFIQFYHYVWYSSDFYFWLLYFNAFIIKENSNQSFKRGNIISDFNNNQISSINTKISDLIFLKHLRKLLKRYFENCTKKLQENYILQKMIYHFNSFFILLSYLLFLGAILKFYFNIKDLFEVLVLIVNNDNKLQIYLTSNSNKYLAKS